MSNEDENLLAILGPTNTGKTYTAFERLISYKSGIFGFPTGCALNDVIFVISCCFQFN